MTAGALKVYTYPTNRIGCIEKLIPAVMMVIYDIMRTHTGKKPANLQVLSGFIYPKPQPFVMIQYFHWSYGGFLSVSAVPWEHMLVRVLNIYRCCLNVPVLQT